MKKSIHTLLLSAAVLVMGLASRGALATTLTDVNIGGTGSASYNAGTGTYTLTTQGSSSWLENIDYTTLTGDFDIRAEVTGVSGNPYTGLIVLNGLSQSDVNAALLMPSVSRLPSPVEYTYSGGSVSTASGSYSWLRLARSGNTISNYASADGATWTMLGSETIALNSTVDVGLYVNDAGPASSSFTSLSGFSQPQSSSLGVPEPATLSLLGFALLGAGVLRRKALLT